MDRLPEEILFHIFQYCCVRILASSSSEIFTLCPGCGDSVRS